MIYQSRSKRSNDQATYAAAYPSGEAFRYHRLCLVLVRSIPPNSRESSSRVRMTLALRIPELRPGETPFLQPLGTDPESASVPDENLQPIALAVAEQKQVPAQRLTRQSVSDQTVQPFEPLAHVGDSGGQIDPCGWTQSKHGLHSLQCTHQTFERTRIKISMHLDPAPARQHHGQPTARFVLRRRFLGG